MSEPLLPEKFTLGSVLQESGSALQFVVHSIRLCGFDEKTLIGPDCLHISFCEKEDFLRQATGNRSHDFDIVWGKDRLTGADIYMLGDDDIYYQKDIEIGFMEHNAGRMKSDFSNPAGLLKIGNIADDLPAVREGLAALNKAAGIGRTIKTYAGDECSVSMMCFASVFGYNNQAVTKPYCMLDKRDFFKFPLSSDDPALEEEVISWLTAADLVQVALPERAAMKMRRQFIQKALVQ